MKSSVIRLGYVLALVASVVYAFFTMRGPHGIAAYVEKRQLVHEMEDGNAILSRENQLKKEYIGRLLQNKEEQELEIRRKLRLVKPNEKVFIKRPE
jgi:cell division protein FtsB